MTRWRGACRRAGLALLSCLAGLLVAPPSAAAPPESRIEAPKRPGESYVYRPRLVLSESVARFLRESRLDSDLFPDERVARELIAHLASLSVRLRARPDAGAVAALLGPTFRGAPLRGSPEAPIAVHPAFQVHRTTSMPAELVLDSRAFVGELGRLLEPFSRIVCAEFLLTALSLDRERGLADSEVRYDLVGPGRGAHRVQRVGRWRLRWKKEAAGWRVAEWRAIEEALSRSQRPLFTDVTAAAFAGNESFQRQLGVGFDAWAATVDATLARDSNGHHGISVGDVDGDGHDDVYVGQPHGFPNRLYRARGDGTFEDVTERAGVGTLEDTQHALFFDVDNDGDQDLVLAISTGPVLYRNDGAARFTREPGAFRLSGGLQGSPMAMAAADYDRDGHLDLYLCVYSYYYGAGEAKAGTPSPYHDAVNGPPNVLFRNDGRGGFVDVTAQTGLDTGNDRFSFSAAWADFDEDGWPDLVVANDFGRKNLYRNLGVQGGAVRFEDVAARAGVEDHAAGMSVFWFDQDGDGRLDIYGGQMWSDNGLRVTANPDFMPKAPETVRALYRHHARGNTLLLNRGGGRFEDVSVKARAEMGRWAWSSGAVDFDSDGWEDVYVVNGMVTRAGSDEDLDWLFWGGIVARSPLVQATGTPYDDAWRAINQLMTERSIAGHQRNVFLRNDGRGGFDDVSGTLGLDLDEDGRAFAILDFDGDGDPDVASLAPRATPQLRLLRNDFPQRGRSLALRLVGAPETPSDGSAGSGRASSRDAIGARVTVETDLLRRVKAVHAGSGFLSQHSKELVFGLGASSRVLRLTVDWPSGRHQVFTDVPLERRLRLTEGGELAAAPYAAGTPLQASAAAPPTRAPDASWLFDPVPVPAFAAPDLDGQERSLAALSGHPALLLFWTVESQAARVVLEALGRGAAALDEAGVRVLALSVDGKAAEARVRAAAHAAGSVPVLLAGDETVLSYAILHRHLFVARQPLPLPAAFLLDGRGRVVAVYRGELDAARIVQDARRIDATPAERLARALPFPGEIGSPGRRDYVPYARELLDNGLDAHAVVAFEQAAQGNPSASVLYRLGSLLARTGQSEKARAAYERALRLQPDLAEASNDLGTLLAEAGEIPAAIERFRTALATTPDYPDALNNLGYALLLAGREQEARPLYERALELQPDFPEALNNLGLVLGRQGELEGAGAYFERALRAVPDYGEAAGNLALVLVGRGRLDEAIALLRDFLAKNDGAEDVRLTLAKVLLAHDRREEGLKVVHQILERNPGHPLARELMEQFR